MPDLRLSLALLAALAAGGCAKSNLVANVMQELKPQLAGPQTPAGAYKVGTPYQIDRVWYYPAEDYQYAETGIASWYGEEFHGKYTANGELFDMNAVTGAHRTLPMPSLVQVTNLENGRSLKVRINDRGPFKRGRIIDLSRRAAELLGFDQQGTAKVEVRILAPQSLELKEAALQGKPGVKPVQLAALGPDLQAGAADAAQAASDAAPSPADALRSGIGGMPSLLAAEQIDVVPVPKTAIFVQAGAFARIENAQRLRRRLAGYGPALVSPVAVDGRQFFRVRVGPADSVAQADDTLAAVIASGYPQARLVVD
jgi:rare lipoprotein A